MHGGPGKMIYAVLALLLIIDIYAFRGVSRFIVEWNPVLRIAVKAVYWVIPLIISILVVYVSQHMSELNSGNLFYRVVYTLMGILILFYVPKMIFSVFQLGNDISNGVIFLMNKFNPSFQIANIQLFSWIGGVFALLLFVAILFGIVHGRYHLKVNNVEIIDPEVPEAFNGFKIIQISDWHIGSFYTNPDKVSNAVKKINSLDPDIIVFTGDLVNNIASETDAFINELSELKAKYGVYSILGNHDYGDYVKWESKAEQDENLNQLKEKENKAGFTLLNNAAVSINKDGDSFSLLGVENWGLPPFPQHGDLDLALSEAKEDFKILLSHDPSHWGEEVLNKTDINLTLSGHTHGMQFGINLKGFKWSPVKLKYPRWAGLYNENGQKLFVSVGIGYIGFPGRVGMRPEIAVLRLIRPEK